MKSRVNLYLAEYRPQLDLMSLSTVIAVFAILLLTVIGIRVGLGFQGDTKKQQLMAVNEEYNQKAALAKELTNILQSRKEDPQLLAVFAGLQASLQDKERLKQALSEREALKSASFSLMLKELAQQHHADLWLTRIVVTESSMNFEGQSLRPEALPQWIGRLGQTEYFSGKEFDQAQVIRQEQNLLFNLTTTRTDTEQPSTAGWQN